MVSMSDLPPTGEMPKLGSEPLEVPQHVHLPQHAEVPSTRSRSPYRQPLPPDMPPWYVAVVAVILLVILGILVVILLRDDGGTDVEATGSSTTAEATTTTEATSAPATTSSTVATTTSTSTAPTTTAAPTTSASASTTVPASTTAPATTASTATTTSTTTVDPEQYRSAVWPWFDSTMRYNDPVEAARGFAEDFIGFEEPLVGPFLQGDSRSGEVEISSTATGPTTVIFVRMLGPDDTWWVLGAATQDIVIDEPGALDEISNPVRVAGRALAFEGTVDVELRADGSSDPLVDSFVTGGGIELAPFEASFDYADPGMEGGALVLMTESAEDGRIQTAAVIRVEFARS